MTRFPEELGITAYFYLMTSHSFLNLCKLVFTPVAALKLLLLRGTNDFQTLPNIVIMTVFLCSLLCSFCTFLPLQVPCTPVSPKSVSLVPRSPKLQIWLSQSLLNIWIRASTYSPVILSFIHCSFEHSAHKTYLLSTHYVASITCFRYSHVTNRNWFSLPITSNLLFFCSHCLCE